MKDFKKLAQEAARETDEIFAEKISTLTRLHGPELLEIMKESGIDKADLSQLLSVVKKSTLSNEQKAEAIKKVNNGLGFLIGVAEKLLV